MSMYLCFSHAFSFFFNCFLFVVFFLGREKRKVWSWMTGEDLEELKRRNCDQNLLCEIIILNTKKRKKASCSEG